MLDAEKTHRQHAIIEQVNADLKAGPLAHLPSGSFAANSAWLVLAAMAFNLTRAAGALASAFHARATPGTPAPSSQPGPPPGPTPPQLIPAPARIPPPPRRLRLHLPRGWPWEQA